MDTSLRALTCPKCGTPTSETEERCLNCGETLFNLCENNHRNKGNARYCKECGAMTTYYKKGYLKDWKDEISETCKGESRNEH